MATNLLKMTEEQFWESTPKKLNGLFKVYKKVNGIEDDAELGCIDDVLF